MDTHPPHVAARAAAMMDNGGTAFSVHGVEPDLRAAGGIGPVYDFEQLVAIGRDQLPTAEAQKRGCRFQIAEYTLTQPFAIATAGVDEITVRHQSPPFFTPVAYIAPATAVRNSVVVAELLARAPAASSSGSPSVSQYVD
jgi:hypothetical protein